MHQSYRSPERNLYMARQITMKEIAKLAKVSQSTVSRVINGNQDVNQEIAKRVLKVIEDVGYVPNKTAQTLKSNYSKLIGISVSEMYNPYFVDLVDHLETLTRKIGYNIILHNAKHNPILEWENVQNFMTRQIDGCLIVPTGKYNLQRISQLPIPVVAITQNVKLLDSVGINHMQAGKLAAESFIRAGHKTFAYIGKWDDDKFKGFESVLYENNYTFDTNNFFELDVTSTNNFLIRKGIEKYLDQCEKMTFTCVFTENDIIALEFMKLAEERNILIPEDISLIGFDDTYLSKIMGISSVHQPIEDMVNTTLGILIDRIENNVASELINIQLEPTLIERGSSKFKRV